MVEEITIQELLKKGIDILQGGDFSNPLLDVQLILSYTLNVSKVYLYTHIKEPVARESVDKFLSLVGRRKTGYPVQYILGQQEFMGLKFHVEEGVLVPRPDTETLVEKVIERVKKEYPSDKKLTIVDIGTGSGAVAVSLANFLKKATVYGIDISEKALNVARLNAQALGVDDQVVFLKGDLFAPLNKHRLQGQVDVVVSNPPYIPSKVIDGLQREVSKFEPRLALDGGEDGLNYYRRIVKGSLAYLAKGGCLALEIGYDQGETVPALMRETGYFKGIEVTKDLAGQDRVVTGVVLSF